MPQYEVRYIERICRSVSALVEADTLDEARRKAEIGDTLPGSEEHDITSSEVLGRELDGDPEPCELSPPEPEDPEPFDEFTGPQVCS